MFFWLLIIWEEIEPHHIKHKSVSVSFLSSHKVLSEDLKKTQVWSSVYLLPLQCLSPFVSLFISTRPLKMSNCRFWWLFLHQDKNSLLFLRLNSSYFMNYGKVWVALILLLYSTAWSGKVRVWETPYISTAKCCSLYQMGKVFTVASCKIYVSTQHWKCFICIDIHLIDCRRKDNR